MIPLKFNRVRLSGHTQIELPIIGASLASPYQVIDISGLGAPEHEVLIGMDANGIGSFHGRRPRGRQLIFTLKLNPNFAVEETFAALRQALYEMAATRDGHFWIELHDDSQTPSLQVNTRGYISKFDSNLFDAEPKVQFTVDCDRAYLESPTPQLETSFLNEGNLGSFSTICNTNVGFEFSATLSANAENGVALTIAPVDFTNDVEQTIDIVFPFLADDLVIIQTEPGKKAVAVVRGTQRINLLPYKSGDWPVLLPGENNFSLHVPQTFAALGPVSSSSILYYPIYQGV